MTGGTADFGAPPTLSGVPCDTVEYGQWTGCVQHVRASAVGAAARPAAGAVCRPGLPDRVSRGPALVVPANFGLVPGPAHGRNHGRRSGAQDIPEMGINSPHLGFTVPANNKVLVTPTRDSPLWPPYFRQTDAGILGRAPQRAPAVFLPTRGAWRQGPTWEPSFFAGFALRCAVAGAAFPDGLDPDDPIHRPESCLRPG